MDVIRKITVNASAEKLWQILADDYDKVGEWTSEIHVSTPNPDLPVGQGRVCTTPNFGDAKETITEFDETRRAFSYTAELASMPFFVREVGNSWRVEAKGENRSVVHMHMKGKLLPIFAQLMGPIMKKQMAKSADVVLEELVYYAENDEVHPRKAEQLKALKSGLSPA
ncbi:MAG: SRPBCC family protein [Chloroflexota bacterium]